MESYLWKTKDVAAYVDVPEGTVRRWRDTRSGPPFIRVGRQVRYRPEAIEAWLESRSVGVGGETAA